ncbi:hypothetical protein [Streptomyces sp. NPDC058424]|uniref:hypothetical protein n=1 Tax=Streptomyces sp. NPDC058424 TaxID=3346491 RepID=UPI00366958DC
MTTTVLGLAEAQQELEAAQREKTQLDERITALEERVRDGNEQDAIEELGRQWAARRLVELRQEAAEQQLREAEAAERVRRLREAEAAAEADLMRFTPAEVAPLFEEAVAAMEKLAAIGAAYGEAVRRHARALVEAGESGHVVFHQPDGFTAMRFGEQEFRSNDSHMEPKVLLGLVQDEQVRRAQLPQRLAQGFDPLEPLPHPVTRYIDEQKSS